MAVQCIILNNLITMIQITPTTIKKEDRIHNITEEIKTQTIISIKIKEIIESLHLTFKQPKGNSLRPE